MQDHPFYLVNIYAPNTTKEQCTFFQEIQNKLEKLNIEVDDNITIGGDFNVILNPEVDGMGGNPKLKESVKKKQQQQMRSSFDLMDIWRIRNPDVKQFTGR